MTTATTEQQKNALEAYYSTVVSKGLYTNRRNLKGFVQTVFQGYDVSHKAVLEVGGGNGLLSFFAASMGAHEVVCLEPEADGSRSGINKGFEQVKNALSLSNVFLKQTTFQAYEPKGKRFDLILLYNSVNHLDEEACIRLQEDPRAKTLYLGLFRRLNEMLNPSGSVIICDANRHNFFDRLGFKSPIVPTIDWRKHQAPEIWSDLLKIEGFSEPRISWTTFNCLGSLGRILLGNRVCSYFLTSHFRLGMTKR